MEALELATTHQPCDLCPWTFACMEKQHIYVITNWNSHEKFQMTTRIKMRLYLIINAFNKKKEFVQFMSTRDVRKPFMTQPSKKNQQE